MFFKFQINVNKFFKFELKLTNQIILKMISFLVGTVVVGGLAMLARPTLRLIKKARIPNAGVMKGGKSNFLEGGFYEEMTKSEAFQILNLE